MTRLLEILLHTRYYLSALAKWVALAVLIGVSCGVVGVLFHLGVEWATAYRESHIFLLWCLPLAGFSLLAFTS